MAVGLRVSVVSSVNLAITQEGSVRNLSEDGIVVSWDSRDGLLQRPGLLVRLTLANSSSEDDG